MSDPQTFFFEALGRGDQAAAELQLDADPGLLKSVDAQGVSPIVFACYRGQMATAEWLAERKGELDLAEALVLGRRGVVLARLAADPMAARGHSADGFSMLGLAVFFGRFDCAALLLGAGADVDAAATNPMRVAPVHAASAQADEERALRLMHLLLAFGANLNAAQAGGWTALHSAAHRDYPSLAALLLGAGADPAARSDDGRTALEMARAENRSRALGVLER